MFNSLTYYLKSLSAVEWTIDAFIAVVISAVVAYFLYKKLHH